MQALIIACAVLIYSGPTIELSRMFGGTQHPHVTAEADPFDAVMRVRFKGDRGYYIASCTCVGQQDDGEWVFVTAQHCFPTRKETADVEIDQSWQHAEVFFPDDLVDVAIMLVEYDGEVPYAKLDEDGLTAQEHIQCRGMMSYWMHTGILVDAENGHALLDTIVAPGDSGGGVFDAEGEYIGVLNGYLDHDNTHLFFTPITWFNFSKPEAAPPVPEEAEQTKPVVTWHTEPWCGPCQRYEKEIREYGEDRLPFTLNRQPQEGKSIPRFVWDANPNTYSGGKLIKQWFLVGYMGLDELIRRYEYSMTLGDTE